MSLIKYVFVVVSFVLLSLPAQAQDLFCHKDFNGRTTKIKLDDNGKGKILIEEDNKVTREGTMSWAMTSNRFPNPEKLTIRLSTGVFLGFDVVKYNPNGSDIDMLIDSRGNQYLKCFDYSDYNYDETDESKFYDDVYDRDEEERITFKKRFTLNDFIEELQGTWSSKTKDVHLIIRRSRSNLNILFVEGDSTSYRIITSKEINSDIDDDMFYYIESTYRNSGLFDWKIALYFDYRDRFKKANSDVDGIRMDYRDLTNNNNIIEVKTHGKTDVYEKTDGHSIQAFLEAQKLRESYGSVLVSLSTSAGSSPEGSFYFKENQLVYADLSNYSLAVSHSNNTEAKFEYDSLLRSNGTFDVKIEPDNLNILFDYEHETQIFKSAPIDALKNVKLQTQDDLRQFVIKIITKDYLGEIKENLVYFDMDLIQIKDVYTEHSISSIIYPLSDELKEDPQNNFTSNTKDNLLKDYLGRIEQYSTDYFIERKWLKRKNQEIGIKTRGQFLVQSDGNITLKSLSTSFDSNSKLKLNSDDIVNFNTYLVEKLNKGSEEYPVIPAKYLIESIGGSDEKGKLIINSYFVPVDFEFEHEHTFKIFK